jgi:hypothetical protein
MGITNGTVTCARCGEWQTTCSLCAGGELLMDHSVRLLREAHDERLGKREIERQSESIKRAANPSL